jgi:hypothetical protein
VLGILRIDPDPAAGYLRESGIDLPQYRDLLRHANPPNFARIPSGDPDAPNAIAPSLERACAALTAIVDRVHQYADVTSEYYGYQRLKRKPWSRKQAIGHLIDWASTHHQWIARALTEPKLVVAGYPQDEWALAQAYADIDWDDLVELWTSLNRFLVQVLARISEEKAQTPCRIGLDDPVPLSIVVDRYVEKCEDIIGQILAHL